MGKIIAPAAIAISASAQSPPRAASRNGTYLPPSHNRERRIHQPNGVPAASPAAASHAVSNPKNAAICHPRAPSMRITASVSMRCSRACRTVTATPIALMAKARNATTAQNESTNSAFAIAGPAASR